MSVRATRIQLTGGSSIEIVDGVTVLVGPSNAGKSLVLREAIDFVSRGRNVLPVRLAVADVEMDYPGTPEEYFERLAEVHGAQEPGQYNYGHVGDRHVYLNNSNVITQHMVRDVWGQMAGSGVVAATLFSHLNAEGRLSLVQDGQLFDPLNPGPNQPMQPAQKLWMNPELEKYVSDILQRAFGVPLTVQRGGAPTITLHVGRPSRPASSFPDVGYLRELKNLPLWREQGDGMRSFLGVVLALTTARPPLVFIDEPEAFLHPPQARLLGRLLVQLAGPDTQVIVATHSAHVLDGLIATTATGKNQMSIARLTRVGSSNNAAQVDAEALKSLYDDPLIRYYNILDGLFANATVLCEADSDCTYYRAVMDTIDRLGDGTPTDALDLHFTHCAGKSRLPTAVKALRMAGAAVVCVADIDVLRDDVDFNRLVTAAGGDPADFQTWRNQIKAAIETKVVKAERTKVETAINGLLRQKTDKYLSSSEVNAIKEALGSTGGWQEAKRYGHSSLSGDAYTAFNKLHAALCELGIVVVWAGELESFHKEYGSSNKAAWLSKVLEERAFEGNEDARKFVSLILQTAIDQQKRGLISPDPGVLES